MTKPFDHDPIYDTTAAGDFASLLQVERYGQRTQAFDTLLSASAEHFWTPDDPLFLDFQQPFDVEHAALMPSECCPELCCAVADVLDEGQLLRLSNEVTRFHLSQLLHGEQGALSLSASLCQLLRDPGTQAYAASQAAEEARHVHALSRYMAVRWGTPLPAGPHLTDLLGRLVGSTRVDQKLVGMQLLVEGLAMGAFLELQTHTRDPLLRRLVRLIMADEALHHRFGQLWARRTLPRVSRQQHQQLEDWAAHCFQQLLSNLMSTEQKKDLYARFGLEWTWVRDAIREAYSVAEQRRLLNQGSSMFRVLLRTLMSSGLITERTRPLYANWFDMEKLEREAAPCPAEDVAQEALAELARLNHERLGEQRRRQARRVE